VPRDVVQIPGKPPLYISPEEPTMPQTNDAKSPTSYGQTAARYAREGRIAREARRLMEASNFPISDETVASDLARKLGNLREPTEDWTTWLKIVRDALARAGLFSGDTRAGAGSAVRPGRPPESADGAPMSITPTEKPLTAAQAQAVANEQWRNGGGTASENAALKARGIDVNLALPSTGYSGEYKSAPDYGPLMQQAAAVEATPPPERLEAASREYMKNTGVRADGGFLPAEEEEARGLIARAADLLRGRESPRLNALMRDAAAVVEGKKPKPEKLLDRLRAEVEEAEWKRRGWSA
jgi:hypothetical protein